MSNVCTGVVDRDTTVGFGRLGKRHHEIGVGDDVRRHQTHCQ